MPLVQAVEMGGVLSIAFKTARVIDEAVIKQAGAELLGAIDGTHNKKVVLNFHGVEFMSSAMFGQLILVNKACQARKITLKLCCLSSKISEAFKVLDLQKMFDIHETEPKALAAMETRPFSLASVFSKLTSKRG